MQYEQLTRIELALDDEFGKACHPSSTSAEQDQLVRRHGDIEIDLVFSQYGDTVEIIASSPWAGDTLNDIAPRITGALCLYGLADSMFYLAGVKRLPFRGAAQPPQHLAH